MKPSSILNLGLGLLTATATALPATEEKSYSVVRRDKCHSGELMVYRTGDSFLCVGKTVFWAGAAIVTVNSGVVSTISSRFATWVSNKITGTATDNETTTTKKRTLDGSYVYDEDDESITYAWSPASLADRSYDNATTPVHIHNMTKQYSKTDGSLMQADMAFESVLDTASLNSTSSDISKRSTTIVYITYWAQSGHQKTRLSWSDLYDLFREIFWLAGPGIGSECGYAANSGQWHGAFKVTMQNAPSAGSCTLERQF